MKVGAHVSTAGGLHKAIDRAVELGAETVQIFCSSPQGWAFEPVPAEQSQAFRDKANAADIHPIFLHGIYLINLGTPNPENLVKGIVSLTHYMDTAAQIGASGVIFHGGSHLGRGYDAIFQQTVGALRQVLDHSPPDAWLCIENSAGIGNHIGATFHEIGAFIQALEDPRVKVCLDTQHLFASGYECTTVAGLEATLEEFDRHIGLSNLVAVHANDSKTPFASGVDRHENLGHGQMGLEGLLVIMSHPAFRDVPFFLEVPGLTNQGPDRENMDVLKELRARAGLGA